MWKNLDIVGKSNSGGAKGLAIHDRHESKEERKGCHLHYSRVLSGEVFWNFLKNLDKTSSCLLPFVFYLDMHTPKDKICGQSCKHLSLFLFGWEYGYDAIGFWIIWMNYYREISSLTFTWVEIHDRDKYAWGLKKVPLPCNNNNIIMNPLQTGDMNESFPGRQMRWKKCLLQNASFCKRILKIHSSLSFAFTPD